MFYNTKVVYFLPHGTFGSIYFASGSVYLTLLRRIGVYFCFFTDKATIKYRFIAYQRPLRAIFFCLFSNRMFGYSMHMFVKRGLFSWHEQPENKAARNYMPERTLKDGFKTV